VPCGPLLICATDLRCHASCASAAECTTGQVCVQGVCADSTDLDVNGQLPQKAPTGVDAGGSDAVADLPRDVGTPDAPAAQDTSGTGGSGGADVALGTGGASGGIDAGADLSPDRATQNADSGTSSGAKDAGCNADGSALCDSGCVNTMNDKYNCGGCGKKCVVSCSNGQCNDPVELSGGMDHNCVRLSNGSVECWGLNFNGQVGSGNTSNALAPGGVVLASGAVSVAAGATHSCAALSDGSVSCWGWNITGQVGNGITINTNSPLPASTLITSGALAVAASGCSPTVVGAGHSCALLSGGTVTCWGNNTYRELGGAPADGGTTASVGGISGATQLIAGPTSSCVLEADGTVRCWGYLVYGAGYVSSPTPVPGLSSGGVKYIAASPGVRACSGETSSTHTNGHGCALLADGSVRCWGNNAKGELGNGTTTDTGTAVPVLGVSGATAVGAGGAHSCAVVSGGTVVCWGNNIAGQLGNGSTANLDGGVGNGLVTVSGIANAKAVVAGGCHTCALLTDGNVQCWGDNSYGQLGNGTTASSSTPVTVTW